MVILSLFPDDDLLAKEIESWKIFGENLREKDRVMFAKMIRDCYKYIRAINAKGQSYSTESLLMSLIISQQQMIEFLIEHKEK